MRKMVKKANASNKGSSAAANLVLSAKKAKAVQQRNDAMAKDVLDHEVDAMQIEIEHLLRRVKAIKESIKAHSKAMEKGEGALELLEKAHEKLIASKRKKLLANASKMSADDKADAEAHFEEWKNMNTAAYEKKVKSLGRHTRAHHVTLDHQAESISGLVEHYEEVKADVATHQADAAKGGSKEVKKAFKELTDKIGDLATWRDTWSQSHGGDGKDGGRESKMGRTSPITQAKKTAAASGSSSASSSSGSDQKMAEMKRKYEAETSKMDHRIKVLERALHSESKKTASSRDSLVRAKAIVENDLGRARSRCDELDKTVDRLRAELLSEKVVHSKARVEKNALSSGLNELEKFKMQERVVVYKSAAEDARRSMVKAKRASCGIVVCLLALIFVLIIFGGIQMSATY